MCIWVCDIRSLQYDVSLLSACFVDTGFPPGVVNIVFGTGPCAGDALVSHPDVPLISFTGSTATARLITERSAPYCKKLSLELGGKNPAIIFADADMEQCISTTIQSSFSNQVSSYTWTSQGILQHFRWANLIG